MATAGGDIALQIEGLVVDYGSTRSVDGLDLSVPTGAFVGLLGPNGAGKTSTIAAVCGLVAPTAGTIAVMGLDALDVANRRAVRGAMGVVPQEIALYTELSVRENLELFASIAGLRRSRLRDRVAWALDLAQLTPRAADRVGVLSGGMQRRLNLACALLHDPPLVICDEPTTGVDPQSRHHLFETIGALHAEGRTIVYTTHYMEEVEALCEQVAILDHGKLVAQDSLAALLGGDIAPRQLAISLAQGGDPADIRAALSAAGIAVESIEPATRSLGDVFLELTGHALRDEDHS